ncbi:hypothetical protein V1477_015983 [Vespula maculifrons]|uniref:Uncharacterized protein n=1 Tax=Vespula maculifrons TaxID=7453 RepID=A0ABD2BBS4_VESMC
MRPSCANEHVHQSPVRGSSECNKEKGDVEKKGNKGRMKDYIALLTRPMETIKPEEEEEEKEGEKNVQVSSALIRDLKISSEGELMFP